mmetsp:Transcript_14515/g.39296  ORF Transcript_14515/g.39296 Transcript_14515/m.39296 type:complete len:228 (+) Transcript_14515:88-771(+)
MTAGWLLALLGSWCLVSAVAGHQCATSDSREATSVCATGAVAGVEADSSSMLQVAGTKAGHEHRTTVLPNTGGTDIGVDGGHGRACRYRHPNDNSESYYRLFTTWPISSYGGCSAACSMERGRGCQGWEWSPGRCELWEVPPLSSTYMQGFVCGRYAPPHYIFEPVKRPFGEAVRAACRRNHPGDNSESYYKIESESSQLGCQQRCLADVFLHRVRVLSAEPLRIVA